MSALFLLPASALLAAPLTPASSDFGACWGYGTSAWFTDVQTLLDQNFLDMQTKLPGGSSLQRFRLYFPSFFSKSVDTFTQFNAASGNSMYVGYNPTDYCAGFDELAISSLPQIAAGAQNVEAVYFLNERYTDKQVDAEMACWTGTEAPSGTGMEKLAKYVDTYFDASTRKTPLLTSQTTQSNYTEYTHLLSQGFDGITVNVYPWKVNEDDGGNFTADEAFDEFCVLVQQIVDYYDTATGPGEHFYGISETGVPSAGCAGCTPENAKAYYTLVQGWVGGSTSCKNQLAYSDLKRTSQAKNGGGWIGVYYFEAASEPQKCPGCAANLQERERNFGIIDAYMQH